ncbi:hypothetical protein SAMN04490197_0213 [Pseudomonas orientalis]|uniref:Uncharacterized protein n=1 Tax=Pseudomonas orientalis TaxID=76758 RepID=A0A8B3XRE3_9PSED|nr:hypothetical protein SAMN04490197_0213 [Pseudomonas orientalis]
MADLEPTGILCRSWSKCGRGLAPDGGLRADRDFVSILVQMWKGACPRCGLRADRDFVSILVQMWKGACPRWRPQGRPGFCVDPGPNVEGGLPPMRPQGRPGFCVDPGPNVEGGLPPMAASEPTGILCRSWSKCGRGLAPDAASGPTRILCRSWSQCGRGLASDGGLRADRDFVSILVPMWEGACPRWRLQGRPGCWIRSSTYPFLRSRLVWVPPLRRLTFEKRKSKQNALAPPLGTSLGLGVPSLRLESVGRRNGPSMAQCG